MEKTDLEATIDFGKETDFETVKIQFFNGIGSWIYLPREVQISSSADGSDFKVLKTEKSISGEQGIVPVIFTFEKTRARYLRVIAKNFGGHPKTGESVWLFVDEIIVE